MFNTKRRKALLSGVAVAAVCLGAAAARAQDTDTETVVARHLGALKRAAEAVSAELAAEYVAG